MKKFILGVAVALVFIATGSIAHGQTAPEVIRAQYVQTLQTLINLLTQQLATLQAQLAAQNALPANSTSTPPLPWPTIPNVGPTSTTPESTSSTQATSTQATSTVPQILQPGVFTACKDRDMGNLKKCAKVNYLVSDKVNQAIRDSLSWIFEHNTATYQSANAVLWPVVMPSVYDKIETIELKNGKFYTTPSLETLVNSAIENEHGGWVSIFNSKKVEFLQKVSEYGVQ